MFPLQPVLPKKMPDATASLRARARTWLMRSRNLACSCELALKAWTVRRAERDSWATLVISPTASWDWLDSFLRYRP